ncbi:hypothetical protein ER45_028805 (plasmid) [Bacillus mycoides]|nr:hypothetical protein ER45_028805 [Bacillus mycoides]
MQLKSMYKVLATTAVMGQLLVVPIMSHADTKTVNTSVQQQEVTNTAKYQKLEDMEEIQNNKDGSINGGKFLHSADSSHKEQYYVTNRFMKWTFPGKKPLIFYFGADGNPPKENSLLKIRCNQGVFGINYVDRLYYFDRSENKQLITAITNQLKTIDGKVYYFGEDGAAITNQDKTIDGKTYHFGEDGAVQGGAQKAADGKWYYIGSDGSMDKTPGWKTLKGQRYYVGNGGAIVTGLQHIEGKDHYFGTEEDIKGKTNANSNYLQLNESSRHLKDIQYVENVGQEARGWVRTKDTANGNEEVVYYAGTGNDNTGLVAGELAGGRDDKGNKINNWKTIDGNHYYFGSGGSDGFTGKDDSGLLPNEMAMGWIKVEGKDYYFSKDEDALKIGDRNENVGEMATGIQKIQGSAYYFDDSGVMAKSGWKDSNGAKYYLGKDGKAFTGLQTVDDKLYYFGEDTNIQWAPLSTAKYFPHSLYPVFPLKDYNVKLGKLLQDSNESVYKIGNAIYLIRGGNVLEKKWDR